MAKGTSLCGWRASLPLTGPAPRPVMGAAALLAGGPVERGRRRHLLAWFSGRLPVWSHHGQPWRLAPAWMRARAEHARPLGTLRGVNQGRPVPVQGHTPPPCLRPVESAQPLFAGEDQGEEGRAADLARLRVEHGHRHAVAQDRTRCTGSRGVQPSSRLPAPPARSGSSTGRPRAATSPTRSRPVSGSDLFAAAHARLDALGVRGPAIRRDRRTGKSPRSPDRTYGVTYRTEWAGRGNQAWRRPGGCRGGRWRARGRVSRARRAGRCRGAAERGRSTGAGAAVRCAGGAPGAHPAAAAPRSSPPHGRTAVPACSAPTARPDSPCSAERPQTTNRGCR